MVLVETPDMVDASEAVDPNCAALSSECECSIELPDSMLPGGRIAPTGVGCFTSRCSWSRA